MTDTITDTLEGLTTSFLSETKNQVFKKYAIFIARNADPGSEVEIDLRNLKHLSDEDFLNELLNLSYNMMIYHNDIILGHVAYQEYKISDAYKRWEVFSVYIDKDHRKQGHGTNLVKTLFNQFTERDIRKMKIGEPKDEDKMTIGEKALKRIVKKLHKQQDDFNVEIYPDKHLIYNKTFLSSL